jgi:hypothetical protein
MSQPTTQLQSEEPTVVTTIRMRKTDLTLLRKGAELARKKGYVKGRKYTPSASVRNTLDVFRILRDYLKLSDAEINQIK